MESPRLRPKDFLYLTAVLVAVGTCMEIVLPKTDPLPLEEVAQLVEENWRPGTRFSTHVQGAPLVLHNQIDGAEVQFYDAGADGNPDSAVVFDGNYRYTFTPKDSVWNWEPRYEELRAELFGSVPRPCNTSLHPKSSSY